MSNFGRLVQNEYIKILKKKSTLFIFIMVIIISIGIAGMMKITDYANSDLMEYGTSDSYDWSDSLNMAKAENDDESVKYYQYLIDNKVSNYDWRMNPARAMFSRTEITNTAQIAYALSSSSTGYYSEYDSFIKNNDWKGYCEFVVEKLGKEATWAYQYRIDNDIPLTVHYDAEDWKDNTLLAIEAYELTIINSNDTNKNSTYEDAIAVFKYQLENDMEINVAKMSMSDEYVEVPYEISTDTNLWSVALSSTGIVTFIGLLIIVIAGGIVASEFSSGTIKFLLINPRTRGKILISKYVTVITIGYIMIFIAMILNLISAGIFFGVGGIGASAITATDGVVTAVPGILYLLKLYMISSVYIVVLATAAFMISSLIKSSSLAIGLSMFGLLSGEGIIMVMKEGFNIDEVRYTIFANADLQSIYNGSALFPGQTITFAVTVIAVHMLVMWLISWDGFVRREI